MQERVFTFISPLRFLFSSFAITSRDPSAVHDAPASPHAPARIIYEPKEEASSERSGRRAVKRMESVRARYREN